MATFTHVHLQFSCSACSQVLRRSMSGEHVPLRSIVHVPCPTWPSPSPMHCVLVNFYPPASAHFLFIEAPSFDSSSPTWQSSELLPELSYQRLINMCMFVCLFSSWLEFNKLQMAACQCGGVMTHQFGDHDEHFNNERSIVKENRKECFAKAEYWEAIRCHELEHRF